MDELFSFIRSLKDANKDNMNYCYGRLSELIETINIQDAKKYRDNYGYGFEFNNIYISAYQLRSYKIINILIGHKIITIGFYTDARYYILEYENIEDIIKYCGKNGEFLNIECKNTIEVKNGSIDWLLDQKLVKSARN